jgi:hypothetical protein
MLNLPSEQRPNRLFLVAKERGRELRDGKIRRDRAEADLMNMAKNAGISESAAQSIIASGLNDGLNEPKDS